MVQFILRNSGPNFYLKNGSFWLFLVNQKLRRNYPVDHRHTYIKVSPLRSPANFMKGIISKILYKLLYFCLIDKKRSFLLYKIPTSYLKTIFKQFFLEIIPFIKFVGLRKGLTLI